MIEITQKVNICYFAIKIYLKQRQENKMNLYVNITNNKCRANNTQRFLIKYINKFRFLNY
ncbi:unnamed protein product [Paramecium sonneborni]|uniref:Uncharacterized protein n=1 Tax=Paramecium sonneborni TaxID=65129 RepID=A0A8S1RE91_9CILI|nr:unnamed protein product [Paramecium sonneborni]